MNQALLVAGMHRSGTSLTASMLSSLGVAMGNRQVRANAANPRGYFEDVDFVSFHRRLFQRIYPARAAGYVDWGWLEEMPSGPDELHLEVFRSEARRLVNQRASVAKGPWGFKDPRATVLLDFWDRSTTDARYVLVYRAPWLVADSIQRLNARTFLHKPHYANRIWNYYNDRMLDFYRRNRERCLLLNIDGLVADAGQLSRLLQERFSLKCADAGYATRIDSSLLHRNDDAVLGSLVFAAYPDTRRIYDALEKNADVRDSGMVGRSWKGYSGSKEPVTVSIVIPTCNDAMFLLEAVASVERSRPPDAEVIIVNDGTSDPDDRRIVRAVAACGFPVIDQPNRGLSEARNSGIAQACGRFLFPLDADNRLLPGFLESAQEVLERDPTCGVVFGDHRLFGESQGVVRVPEFKLCRQARASCMEPTALFRRALWEDVGGYDPAMPISEDWEFWLNAGARGWRFQHVDMVGFEYRVRPGSMLGREGNPATFHRAWSRLIEKHARTLHRCMPPALRKMAAEPVDASRARGGEMRRWMIGTYWRIRWLPRGLVLMLGARVWWRRVLRRARFWKGH